MTDKQQHNYNSHINLSVVARWCKLALKVISLESITTLWQRTTSPVLGVLFKAAFPSFDLMIEVYKGIENKTSITNGRENTDLWKDSNTPFSDREILGVEKELR